MPERFTVNPSSLISNLSPVNSGIGAWKVSLGLFRAYALIISLVIWTARDASAEPGKVSASDGASWIVETILNPKEQSEAIQTRANAHVDAVNELYCGDEPTAPDEQSTTGCDDAQFEIGGNGAVKFRHEKESGTWCLSLGSSSDAFARPRALLLPRGATKPSAGVCGEVKPGVVYKPLECGKHEAVTLTVWDRPYPREGDSSETKLTEKDVISVFDKVVTALLVEQWLASLHAEANDAPLTRLYERANALNREADSGLQSEFDSARIEVLTNVRTFMHSTTANPQALFPNLDASNSSWRSTFQPRMMTLAKTASDVVTAEVPRAPLDVGMSGSAYLSYLDERLHRACPPDDERNGAAKTPLDSLPATKKDSAEAQPCHLKSKKLTEYVNESRMNSKDLLSVLALYALARGNSSVWQKASKDVAIGRTRLRFVLPATRTLSKVIAAKPNSGPRRAKSVEPTYGETKTGFFAHDIPRGVEITAAFPEGTEVASAPVAAVAALAEVLVQLGTVNKPAVEGTPPPLSRPSPFETDPMAIQALSAAVRTEPSAPLTTQLVVRTVQPNKEYNLLLCTQKECGANTDKEKITASRTFRVKQRHHSISLGAELAGNISGEGAYPIGGYRFSQVGGVEGPDQLYRLDERSDIADHFTTSSLLLYYPFAPLEKGWFLDGFVVAAGPSLFRGGDSDFLKQWNFRVGLDPWGNSGLLVTAGYSLRYIQIPTELEPGAIIAVARDASPRPFDKEQAKGHYFSMGITLDSKVLTDAAGKLLGNEGSKEADK